MSEQKKRIVGAVTHVDEITLQLCCDSLRSQTVQLDEIKVVSGVTPAFTAFNECLDWAVDQQADILIHSAADCIATNDAVQHLVKNMGPSTYVVTGRGFDMINGEDAPVGIWALNIALIRDRFRFRDAFKMDLDFCDRIEAETNWTRGKTKRGKPIGYHHPIWLPREMYLKFRYNAQKYRGKELRKYIDFFDQCLAKNPTNKTLQIGLMGLKRGASEVHGIGAPNREAFAEEWNDVGDLIPAGDDEFFAYHAEFIEIAKEIIPSNLDVQPMAVTSITGLTANKSSLCKAAKQSDSNLSLRLRMELYANRIFRQGKSVGKELLRPIYDVMPEGLKQRYRSTRGHPPATVRERIANVPMAPREFSHGSIAEGRLDWERRWRSAHKSQRVLIVAPKDFAGSMYKWTEALNRHTTYAARLITFEEHQYGYPLDLVVPECDDARFQNVMSLADEAGTFHLKDEHSWFLGGERFANQRLLQALFFDSEFETVPKVFTHYGGYARKFKSDPNYIAAVSRFADRIAMTPDLNYEWFDGHYIPHTIDIENIPFMWQDSRVFAHSPSSPEKKATYLFEEAVRVLPKQYPAIWEGWSVDLIKGVSFAECMKRKQGASLFFDQAGRHRVADLGIDDVIGWYGNSAIEAMAFGIPTMAHMSDYALSRAFASGVDIRDSPVINIERSRGSMVDSFVAFASAEPTERLALARKTRAFTESFHGYQACAERLAEVYKSVSRGF